MRKPILLPVNGAAANGGAGGAASRAWPPSPYDPRLRRRNLRFAWILGILAVGFLLSSYWLVRGGWVRPGPVIWQFPWSHTAYKADF
ncbi:MAG TPA: hypothetical protein VE996_01755 [Terriglobales bacterium]|jgi:hypothetical protein|nr:hypothetical protein [Terriglobales bacterium]